MKLFTRYSRINLLATVIVFLLSGISFYFVLRFILIDQVDEDLKIEQHEIENYAAKYSRLPEIISVRDQQISYTPVAETNQKRIFRTLPVYDSEEGRAELSRQLTFYIETGNQRYRIQVRKSLEGTEKLNQSIVAVTLMTILLILVVTFFVNRLVLRKLWQPFYASLAAMNRFELGKKQLPVFPATTIDEFMVMNQTMNQATQKAEDDYAHLKDFTENASHELQTPLAIITSKLDVLIQDEQLTEYQSKLVQSAYEAIQRLSRLNQGLLLLTKIENGQYAETVSIDIAGRIKDKLVQFDEMIAAKELQVKTSFEPGLLLRINPVLTDILLNNLFSNAIKYNVTSGTIEIVANQNLIEFSNTGEPVALDSDKLFRRFSKPGQTREGIGLGLAIVQQAADASGYQASYYYKDQQHHFSIMRGSR